MLYCQQSLAVVYLGLHFVKIYRVGLRIVLCHNVKRILYLYPSVNLVEQAFVHVALGNGVHCFLAFAQVERIVVVNQSLVYAVKRSLEADGSRIFLSHIQLTLACNLCYVVMLGKCGVAYPLQSLVGFVNLSQCTVVSAHVAQHAYVVVVRVNVRFDIGLSFYLPQVKCV